MSIFQELDIEVDLADYRPAVLRILAAIRPQWKKEEICILVRSLEILSSIATYNLVLSSLF